MWVGIYVIIMDWIGLDWIQEIGPTSNSALSNTVQIGEAKFVNG